MNFDLIRPCVDCPFLRSRKFLLNKDRVREILDAITRQQQTFACHKTAEHDDDGEDGHNRSQQHCAGALILLENIGLPNQLMRIAERVGGYDRRKLDMDADVFASPREMLAAKHWLSR